MGGFANHCCPTPLGRLCTSFRVPKRSYLVSHTNRLQNVRAKIEEAIGDDDGPLIITPNREFIKRDRTQRLRGPRCTRCIGSGLQECLICHGCGRLNRGGFHKRNPINWDKVVGTKWTAMESTFGWRHFYVKERKKQNKMYMLLLEATCDVDTKFWINGKNLKERERWAAGWIDRVDMQALESNEVTANDKLCKKCHGVGQITCSMCKGTGHPSASELVNIG